MKHKTSSAVSGNAIELYVTLGVCMHHAKRACANSQVHGVVLTAYVLDRAFRHIGADDAMEG